MRFSVRSVAAIAGAISVLIGAVGSATAHVEYVTPGGDPTDVLEFLIASLTTPFNLAIIGAGGLAVTAVGIVYLRLRPLRTDIKVFRRTLGSYEELLPWLLRLSIGLPLVGAGFSGYFFSPAVQPPAPVFVRLFGITIGFLLLFGFGTRLVAAIGLVSYLVAFTVQPALMLAFEYVPGFLAIALVGGGRPSADHVVASMAADDRTLYSRIDPFYRQVALPFVERTKHLTAYVPTVIRIGVGISFIYLGVAQKLMRPGEALAVVAKYDLTTVVPVPPELWVLGAGLTEALVGVLLIVGAFTRAAAGVAFLLFVTTLFGLPDDPVLAHISLFGLVSALLVTGGGPLSIDRVLHKSTRMDAAVSRDPVRSD